MAISNYQAWQVALIPGYAESLEETSDPRILLDLNRTLIKNVKLNRNKFYMNLFLTFAFLKAQLNSSDLIYMPPLTAAALFTIIQANELHKATLVFQSLYRPRAAHPREA